MNAPSSRSLCSRVLFLIRAAPEQWHLLSTELARATAEEVILLVMIVGDDLLVLDVASGGVQGQVLWLARESAIALASTYVSVSPWLATGRRPTRRSEAVGTVFLVGGPNLRFGSIAPISPCGPTALAGRAEALRSLESGRRVPALTVLPVPTRERADRGFNGPMSERSTLRRGALTVGCAPRLRSLMMRSLQVACPESQSRPPPAWQLTGA